MSRKSVLCGYTCQNHFVVVMLPLVLTVFCTIQSNNVAESQAIMNQLAALFRSRPAWPTNFPSGTTTNPNGVGDSNQNETPSFSDALNNQIIKNPGLEDFSHFNDLLTGQSINQLHPNGDGGSKDNGGSKDTGEGQNNEMSFQQQLYPGAPILATSHPMPQLEMPNPSGNGKSILIAHPVLGPNPNEPPESPEHKFNGMMVNPLNLLNDNAGLYSATQRPKPSAVRFPKNFNLNRNNNNNKNDRLKNSFQNFAHKLFFPNSNHQNNNNHKNNFQNQKMIQVSGKPPPGGKIIAIPVPVPSTSSLWSNHQNFQGGRHQNTPQIIAVRHPFPPITSAPTQNPQGITSFLAKFSPSSMDLSSYAPVIQMSTTSADFAFPLVATNATTTQTTAFSTPVPATSFTFPDTTTLPPYQGPKYTDQISSGSGDNEQFTSTAVTESTTTHRPSNNIQDMIQNSGTQVIHGSPSSVVNSFRYPDPPTPPRLQNMNTRYELQNQDPPTTKSEWVPKLQKTTPATKSAAYYNSVHSKNGNNNTNGFFSPISSIPHISSSTSLRGSRSNTKWKYEDSSNSASVATSTSTLATGHGTNFKGHSDSDQIKNHKSAPTRDPSFKPSLQLHSFEDTTSGLKEFITINPHSSSNKKKSRDGKSLMFQSTAESSLIPYDIKESNKDSPVAMEMMESGFRPFNFYAFANGISSASVSSTTESSMMNRLRDEFTKDIVTANVWSSMGPTQKTGLGKGIRQNRQFFSAAPVNGYVNTKPFYAPAPGSSSITIGASYAGGYNSNIQQNNAPLKSSDWVGRFGQYQFPFTPTTTSKKFQPKKYTTSTASSSSSELYEDWLLPSTKRKKENKDHHKYATESKSNPSTSSFSISASSSSRRLKRPSECEKFDRFGFCPVSSHYPLDKVESIGVRCIQLLSHLIAPLPKTDVRYDVIVPKNSSHKGKSSGGQSAWNWKTFAGKPVCDTKEAKVIPGWAKNEMGEWLVVLQTEEWKQEAQISLCTQNSHPEDKEEVRPKMKCVQRFTAQRLVVLDPDNEDRCPVVRSVFFPSACVCLNDGNGEKHGQDKKEKKSKHSSRHHHHKHGKNSTSSSSTGGGSDDKKESSPSSKFISGRSLLTSLFGLDLDPASGGNREVIHPAPKSTSSSQQESDAKSSEESKNPENPSNSPFMIIEEESETSTESGESEHKPSKRSVSSSLGSSFLRAQRSSNGSDNIKRVLSLNSTKNEDNFSNG